MSKVCDLLKGQAERLSYVASAHPCSLLACVCALAGFGEVEHPQHGYPPTPVVEPDYGVAAIDLLASRSECIASWFSVLLLKSTCKQCSTMLLRSAHQSSSTALH